MELLIVIGLIALLAAIAIALLNPWTQIGKSYDAKRKRDLNELRKVFEDFYNDKGCYPKPSEICYDTPINLCTGVGINKKVNNQICHICGNESAPPNFSNFSPYLSRLPCDPQHPSKKYLYQVEGDNAQLCTSTAEKTCPQRYKIFSEFSNIADQNSEALGCTLGGCGPANPLPPLPSPPYGYDYGVSSPNITINGSSQYNCYNGSCQGCGSLSVCKDPEQSPGCFDKPLYSSCQTCQTANGGNPGSCPPLGSADF